MKTKDRIKEEIGLNKLLITIFSAIEMSLFTWVWNNEKVITEKILPYCVVYSLLIMIIMIYFLTYSKIKELDKYD